MKVLIDTHIFLWFIEDNPALSANARNLIEDKNNEILLSMASLWEMAIKISLGKLQVGGPFAPFITQQLSVNNIGLLPIGFEHVTLTSTLAFHHRDPFDRLIIAQAIVEQIPIISVDAVFDAYSITRLS